jgi:hypothetical protein
MECRVVSKPCVVCGKINTVVVDRAKYIAWKNKEGLIQDLLSENTAGEREFLISGICEDCFDVMFPSFDEEEEIENV